MQGTFLQPCLQPYYLLCVSFYWLCFSYYFKYHTLLLPSEFFLALHHPVCCLSLTSFPALVLLQSVMVVSWSFRVEASTFYFYSISAPHMNISKTISLSFFVTIPWNWFPILPKSVYKYLTCWGYWGCHPSGHDTGFFSSVYIHFSAVEICRLGQCLCRV